MKSISKIAVLLCALAQFAASVPAFGQLLPSPTPVAVPTAVAAPDPDGPRIKFAETRFDFGRVQSAPPVQHEFIFTNTGKAMLEILSVRPGCPGCTTALPWDRQVAPGQTGKIPIQFNPAGFSGSQSKSVTVTCNDPTQPTHNLSFQATIWQAIEVQPAYVYFLPIEGEATNETKIVRIVSNLEQPLTLQAPRSENPAFKLELKTVQPGKEFALHITQAGVVTNAAAPSAITIATSATNLPPIKLTAAVMPQPALSVSPPQIQVPQSAAAVPTPTGPASAGYRHTQMIRNNSNTPMKIAEATVNAEGVTVEVKESQPGKLFLLTVVFPPDFKIDPGAPLALTVKTSHPRRPIISVPIVQSGAPRSFGRPLSNPSRAPSATPQVAPAREK